MRKQKEIQKEYDELWEKVWWHRHTVMSKGRESEFPKEAFDNARRIEEKYGKENLLLDDAEWAIMEGQMSALSWVMGSEWEGSMDT